MPVCAVRVNSLLERVNFVGQEILNELEQLHEETFDHSIDTGRICEFLARKSGLNVEYSKYLGEFHDVGKVEIAREHYEILTKENLSKEEFCEFIVPHQNNETARFIAQCYPEVELHHEKIDGSGYKKVPGNKLNKYARILAVADIYSALTLPREYRKNSKPALSHEEAIALMRKMPIDQYFVDLLVNYKR